MKKKINIKIGGYLFMLIAVYHCIIISMKYWVLIKPFIARGDYIWFLGVFTVSGSHSPENSGFIINRMLTFGYFYGFMMFMVGLLCTWIERKLNRAVPLFISILLFIIFSNGLIIQFPYTHFPYPQFNGPWCLIYVSLYMILCNILDRRAKRVSENAEHPTPNPYFFDATSL